MPVQTRSQSKAYKAAKSNVEKSNVTKSNVTKSNVVKSNFVKEFFDYSNVHVYKAIKSKAIQNFKLAKATKIQAINDFKAAKAAKIQAIKEFKAANDAKDIERILVHCIPKPLVKRPVVTRLTTDELIEKRMTPTSRDPSGKYQVVLAMINAGSSSEGYDIVGEGIWGLTPEGYYWKHNTQDSYYWLDWYSVAPIPNDTDVETC
jgi:hypothetical protein